MEADFLSVYNLDLRAALWGERRIGSRRLLALLKGLPATAATYRVVSMEESRRPPTAEDLRGFFGDALEIRSKT